MWRLRRWPLAWVALLAAPAAAQEAVVESFELKDTAALVTACTVPADSSLYQSAKGFCLGFMTGAMHLYSAAAASPRVKDFVCPGHVVSRAEMRAVFLDWAAAHPEHMSEPAIDGLVRAAVDKFPCEEKPS